MVRRLLLAVVMAMGVLALGACTDPVIGTWKTKKAINECGQKGKMEIADDLGGTAKIPISCDVWCEADVTATETSEGYDLKVKIKTPDLCLIEGNLTKATYGCVLENDDTQLDCGNFWKWTLSE